MLLLAYHHRGLWPQWRFIGVRGFHARVYLSGPVRVVWLGACFCRRVFCSFCLSFFLFCFFFLLSSRIRGDRNRPPTKPHAQDLKDKRVRGHPALRQGTATIFRKSKVFGRRRRHTRFLIAMMEGPDQAQTGDTIPSVLLRGGDAFLTCFSMVIRRPAARRSERFIC